ncbi:MAG: haloalkane dehalogenase [Alphaproteobacteria bacterium]|nr:haloalkane dehalogenase [Alphaproteobacteria bacterium]
MTRPLSDQPFAGKRFVEALGRRMAAVDAGAGRSIVFQHGNPTSSYLWRNVMRGCEGLGRLVACDLIGMGDSDKIPGTGDARYSWDVHYAHLSAAFDALDLGDDILLVIHDWGSSLGLQWAMDHADRVAGIVYMEGIPEPMSWAHWPANARPIFEAFRSAAGEELIFAKNMFIEGVLRRSVIRPLTETEMDEYRRPYLAGGEDRRPMLAWPRQIPLDGEPAAIADKVRRYADFHRTSPTPKLFINADPGSILVGPVRDACRGWANQREVTVKGLHFIQEDSPYEIADAIRAFVAEIG